MRGIFILIRSYSADSSVADSKKLISLLASSVLVEIRFNPSSCLQTDGREKSFAIIVRETVVEIYQLEPQSTYGFYY